MECLKSRRSLFEERRDRFGVAMPGGEREPLWTHLPEHAEHGRGPQQPVERGRVTSRKSCSFRGPS